MSSLISTAAVLTVSRLANFSVMLLSPLLLVRILDVTSYGQYQEFMAYAIVLASLSTFAVDTSLTYLLPRHPDRQSAILTQTSLLILATSGACAILLLAAQTLLVSITSYDFVVPLAAYVFFFVNLGWLEYFWVAQKRPKLVLFYSIARVTGRILVLLGAAITTRDVPTILWSLTAFEASHFLTAGAYLLRNRMLTGRLRKDWILEQVRFAAPVGAAAVAQALGRNAGKIFTSTIFGPSAVALYAVGAYLLPVIRVLRSGIQDAIYPDLVRSADNAGAALRLWQRGNILNCAMFFPAFVALLYFSKEIISILFTEEYLPATAIFQVYCLFLIRRSFNTDVLLRTTGQTAFMLTGAVGALVLNLSLIFALSWSLGILGPAVAFIVSEVGLELYYSAKARKALRLSIAELADWRSMSNIALSCLIAYPILWGGDMLKLPDAIRVALSSAAYTATTLVLAYALGVKDIGRVAGYLFSRVSRAALK